MTSEKAQVRCQEIQRFCQLINQEMADELGLPYYETSAATGEGVEDAVDGLLSMVMARIERSLEVHTIMGVLTFLGSDTNICRRASQLHSIL